MKLEHFALIAALALSQSVLAVDAGDRSPADTNPKCMDRATDSSTGDCIIKDEGTPRHIHPPKPEARPITRTVSRPGTAK